jgi:hypothetical protein
MNFACLWLASAFVRLFRLLNPNRDSTYTYWFMLNGIGFFALQGIRQGEILNGHLHWERSKTIEIKLLFLATLSNC